MVLKYNKHLMRQLMVMSAVWLEGIGIGVALAYPTVLQDTSTSRFITITSEQSSWLAACAGLSSIFGDVIFAALLDLIGRKFTYIILHLVQLTSCIILYCATSITWLFAGRFFQGLCFGCIYINGLLISEYSDIRYRSYFITILKVAMSLGSLICRCLSFWTWREPAAAASAISVLGLIINMFWPESPPYSAMKGDYVTCKKSFKWLHGFSARKQKELSELIMAQTESRQEKKEKHLLKAMKDKSFLKAMLIYTLLTLVVDSGGRYFVIAYITQIMMDLVGSGSAVYYSIFVDTLAIVAFFLSCFILKLMKRRTILFTFGSLSGALMLCIALVLYLKRTGINAALVGPILIIAQNFVFNLGVIPACFTLFGEIFPLDYRGLGSGLAGIMFSIFHGINIKITPMMMRDLGLEGTYGAYGVCLLISLFSLYFLIPETKNKTLQQIEDELMGKHRNSSSTLRNIIEESQLMVKNTQGT